MTPPQLRQLASTQVEATIADLPAELRSHAVRLPILFLDLPSPEILADEFEPDILGLFVGPPHGADTGDSNDVPVKILLFTLNIWDYAAEDEETYLDEIHLTYLHELGHYFGWDEDDLVARELD
ncbi:MAG: metallopeptidase family protein [Candidatus Synoicihabitans palmerolidicus]|nr:metallopeptidase family protein [Candidatus Synoicihabitans palmerolidicus]MCC5022147.1 metallopeptidase family protein [Candidatus Synoicihabitans palmerolidicus]